METFPKILILKESNLRKDKIDGFDLMNFNIPTRSIFHASLIIYVNNNGDIKVMKSRYGNISYVERLYNLVRLQNKIKKINGDKTIDESLLIEQLLEV